LHITIEEVEKELLIPNPDPQKTKAMLQDEEENKDADELLGKRSS